MNVLSRYPFGSETIGCAQFGFLLICPSAISLLRRAVDGQLGGLMDGSIDFSRRVSIVDKKSRSLYFYAHIAVNFAVFMR